MPSPMQLSFMHRELPLETEPDIRSRVDIRCSPLLPTNKIRKISVKSDSHVLLQRLVGRLSDQPEDDAVKLLSLPGKANLDLSAGVLRNYG